MSPLNSILISNIHSKKSIDLPEKFLHGLVPKAYPGRSSTINVFMTIFYAIRRIVSITYEMKIIDKEIVLMDLFFFFFLENFLPIQILFCSSSSLSESISYVDKLTKKK